MKEIIVAIVGSGALSALISGIFNYARDNRQKRTGTDKAVQLLLLAELERQADKHCTKGSVKRQDLKLFMETYEAYHNLGGNGYADDMRADVCSLPVKS